MTCRHCHQPIQRCTRKRCPFYDCREWVHARDQQHSCEDAEFVWYSAEPEPEPGTLPTVQAPTSKPGREVA